MSFMQACNALRSALPILVLLSPPLSAAGQDPLEKQYQAFASKYSFNWPEFGNSAQQLFTDHNYSGSWHRISLQQQGSCEDCYRVGAYAKLRSGRQIAQLSRSSESGDWAQEITYIFSQTGTLMGVFSLFNCAWGWSYIEEFQIVNGKPTRVTRGFQDLETRIAIPAPANAAEMRAHLKDVPLFLNTSKLPFSKLIEETDTKNAQTH